MTPWLEIILPVRNPGDRLAETTASLRAQTRRGFGVVLSDNFSTSGLDHLQAAQQDLETAGIPVRRVRPPSELGRVQHWNWAHAQGQAEWLKPLFVGDLLQPGYVERVEQRLEKNPHARAVRCEFESRSPGKSVVTRAPFTEDRVNPSKFLRYFPSHGNWIGGPINMAYQRVAWQSVGGYPLHFPACADLHLNAMLALRFGLEVIHEPLAVFQLHEQRFSHGIRRRNVNGCFELWLILRQMRNHCLNAKLPWPDGGVRQGVAFQMRVDYWQPFKQRIKKWLGRSSV